MNRFHRLEQDNRRYLAMSTVVRRNMIRSRPLPPGLTLRYSCPEEVVLFDGVTTYTEIETCRFPPMQVGNCFGNAFRLTLENPELRYCEGWALMEQSYPTHHGWVMHPDGSVSDPTWLSLVQEHRDDPRSKFIPDYRARCVYLGVVVPRRMHVGWMLEKGTPNLLSMGEMTDPEVLEFGIDAYARYAVSEDEEPAAVKACLALLDEAPKWELSPCKTFYRRTRPDGQIEEWRGEDTGIQIVQPGAIGA